MPFSPIQIYLTANPVSIWGGVSGVSVMLYNPDVNNTVNVGYDNTITVGGLNSIPLGPGQSVVIDGSHPVYACAPSGTAATVVIPGGGAFFLGVTQGQGSLVLPSIHAPNYAAGVSGWSVNKNGSAEFNDVTIRAGEVIDGTNLFYDPSPGPGNLIVSAAGQAGTDAYGNAYLPYYTVYAASGSPRVATQIGPDSVIWYTAATEAGPWSQSAAITVTPQVMTIGIELAGLVLVGPSGDTSGATDFDNINTALLTSGSTVSLMPGTYYVNAPIVMPDQSCLTAYNPSWAIPTGNYGAGGLPLQGSIIQAGSGFSGSSLISIGSAGTSQHGGQRLYGITLSGTGAPASTHGILSRGYMGGVKMRDVVVWGVTGDGLLAENDGTAGHNPDFWQVMGCKFSDCGNWGVNLTSLSDSWFTDCESTGNGTGGWSITNGADTRFTACRGSSNGTGDGWSVTGLSGFTGTITMTACEANLNKTGIAVSGSGTGTLILNGTYAKGNTTAPWSYAGSMNIESSAAWNTSTAAPTLS